jgi:hypothetical protein
MRHSIPKRTIDELVEKLAAIEHERWSHWQRYLHGKCERQPDGSLLIPADLVQRWQEQFERAYSNLTDEEKQSDRDQVDRYLPLVLKTLDIEPAHPNEN